MAAVIAVLAHVLALGLLALGSGRFSLPDMPDSGAVVELTLQPLPRSLVAPSLEPDRVPAATPRAAASVARVLTRPELSSERAAPAATIPPGVAPGVASAAKPGDGAAAAAARALRGFGRGVLDCEGEGRSTAEARARCQSQAAAVARTAPAFDAMDPIKRARFDAAAARSRKCRFYKTPVPMSTPRDRNDGIVLADRKVEAQLKESNEDQPEAGLMHRFDCWP